MFEMIVAAIISLQPHLPTKAVQNYAQLIVHTSQDHGEDPFLVVAIIHRETGGTWNRKLKSRTRDHGLMQVHVAGSSSPMYRRREHLLYIPAVNIRRGVYLLAFFREWHNAHCGADARHPYWVHYKFGFRRPTKGYVDLVGEIYAHLLAKAFGWVGEV